MAAENFKVKKGLEVGTGTTINATGINITGVVTATQIVGDGSGLTNVVGSGSGVVVKDEGSAVGTAGTINFVGTGVAATLSAGTATVTVNSGSSNVSVANQADNRLITATGTTDALNAESNLISFITCNVSLKSFSDSPGNPTIISVEIPTFGSISLILRASLMKYSFEYVLFIRFKILLLPACKGR